MTSPAVRRPPPIVGQLRDGSWAVFNAQNTPLWEQAFQTQREAKEALKKYAMTIIRIVDGMNK